METQNIKASPTINGYTAYEEWDALTLIKLLWKDGLLQTTTIKKKHSAVLSKYENEWKQMCYVLKNLFIKEPKNLTFSKRQLYYFSQNLQLFKPCLKVLYTFCEGKNIGRVYPAGSLGFTNTRKEIRHTFCRDKWVDIDISNAHPNLLNQLYQGRHVRLNDYCQNRIKYFDMLKEHFTIDDGQQFLIDDDICKSYFIICVLYNGGWDSFCSSNGLPTGVPVPDFHNELMSELDNIYQDLLPKYPDLANQLSQEKDWNLQGSLISWICQEQERKCLEAMVDFATREKLISKTKKDRYVVLAYDGLQLIKNSKINALFLRKMETFIMEQTGYDLKLTTKPFDRGFTADELDFVIEEPPPLDDDVFNTFEIMGEFLDLPADEEQQIMLCKEIFDKFAECLFTRTEVDIARAIKALFQGKIVFVGEKTWYFYRNMCWIKDDTDMVRSIISEQAYNVFVKILEACENLDGDEEFMEHNKKRMTAINELLIDLKMTNQKNNIYREMKEVCLNSEFAKDFNLAKNVLPLKDGLLLNLIDNTTRKRTIADKFNYECPVSLVDNYENGETYLKQVFTDDMETLQVFCDVIKSAVSGTILRYLFICSGDGSNGKSLLFGGLDDIFGSGMDTLSKKLFIETKQNASLNTEYEKLNKVRIGYIQEIDADDKLNQSAVKTITGGDKINLRTLFKTDESIVPTASIFMCVNIEPKFDVEKSVVARLINFPFKADFPVLQSFKETIKTWYSEIFSYIILKGRLIDKVVPSPAMIEKKEEHQKDQVDYLKDFVLDRINILEPTGDDVPLKEKKAMTNHTFYNAFVSWCKSNNIYNYPSQVAVSRKLKSVNIRKKEQSGKTWYLDVEFKIEEEEEENKIISGI